ncbi:hypothetical protein Cgig2_016855 [Carnegiea gigantea]|uniref:Uncharacterized protein n=1 Tax=Carnegiea gigantea TaxID=171969 RepID=A0A9Q1QCI8_9CARY|nr:hypothetical protein Cgig2_016855 [Carnegiea gigantea]
MASKTGCLCSPTKHPGSFRCHLHRQNYTDHFSINSGLSSYSNPIVNTSSKITSRRVSKSNRSIIKSPAKRNSVSRAFLLQIVIKPSSHALRRRRKSFQPKPTREKEERESSMATKKGVLNPNPNPKQRSCLCSPTTHPGSFRCQLHRNSNSDRLKKNTNSRIPQEYLEMAVMARANSLKAFLLQMINPSSHDLQRRRNFHPKPSRFSLLNNNNSTNHLHHGVPVS